MQLGKAYNAVGTVQVNDLILLRFGHTKTLLKEVKDQVIQGFWTCRGRNGVSTWQVDVRFRAQRYLCPEGVKELDRSISFFLNAVTIG